MQLTPSGRRALILVAAVIIIANAVLTVYLLKTVADQGNKIKTLERNDKVTQSVKTLQDKVDGLKNRVQDLFK